MSRIKYFQHSIFLIFFINIFNLTAQNKEYWQQEVKYSINVELNDKDHTLFGNLDLWYINNSPNSLDEIYFHLWPNAYKDQSTAFAKQQLENGSTDFYFSKKTDRGFIEEINFTSKSNELEWDYDKTHPDIALVKLGTSLKSGDSLLISTPFKVKIPKSFSRLGHEDQSYQICQWYPKPAVYDSKGWHPMPYLNQGEFYSEFGSFDIKITLPENYVVAATGNLKTESEKKWLEQKAKDTAKITEFDFDSPTPGSSETKKTIHYQQNNVHDFAWVADKRFHVLKGEQKLSSGKVVETWSMFTNQEAEEWKNSITYLNDAVKMYSSAVGEYPFKQVSAVQSTLSVGSGMEYPNMTIIGLSGSDHFLEQVLVHEVGHNWFYGQLGTNERDYPWLDESVNSYYEERYFDDKYPDRKLTTPLKELGKVVDKVFDLDDYPPNTVKYYGYLANARINEDQPINLKSTEFTPYNYGAIVYGKGAMAFQYLEAYLGKQEFDRIMQSFYQKFEFKHPQPEDFRYHFEKESGKFLDWFFDELLATTGVIDYKIHKVEKNKETIGNSSYDELSIKNKFNNVRGPYSIGAYKENTLVKEIWYDGFSGKMDVLFPSGDYDLLMIDHNQVIPEKDRGNNKYKLNGLFKRGRPLRFQGLGSIENPRKRQLFWLPLLAYNQHDKFMLGMAFYNSIFPKRAFEYTLAPMYAFGSKGFAGMGSLAYNIYPNKGFIKNIKLGVEGKTFNHAEYIKRDSLFNSSSSPFRYYKLAPELSFQFRNKSPRSHVSKTLQLRHVNIRKSKIGDCPEGSVCFSSVSELYLDDYYINEASFILRNNKALNPYGFKINLQQSDLFIKSSVELDYTFSYRQKNKGTHIRLFAGTFLKSDLNGIPQNLFKFNLASERGIKDYTFDNMYIGRTIEEGWTSNQINDGDGNFRWSTAQSSVEVGTSDEWLTALNLEIDYPGKIPLSLYLNIGAYQPKTFLDNQFLLGINNQVLFDAGLALKLIPNAVEIYIPLAASSDFVNSINNNAVDLSSFRKYLRRVTFQINLNRLNPLKKARNFSYNDISF